MPVGRLVGVGSLLNLLILFAARSSYGAQAHSMTDAEPVGAPVTSDLEIRAGTKLGRSLRERRGVSVTLTMADVALAAVPELGVSAKIDLTVIERLISATVADYFRPEAAATVPLASAKPVGVARITTRSVDVPIPRSVALAKPSRVVPRGAVPVLMPVVAARLPRRQSQPALWSLSSISQQPASVATAIDDFPFDPPTKRLVVVNGVMCWEPIAKF